MLILKGLKNNQKMTLYKLKEHHKMWCSFNLQSSNKLSLLPIMKIILINFRPRTCECLQQFSYKSEVEKMALKFPSERSMFKIL